MSNTIVKNKKRSQMTMSDERRIEVNTPGSLNTILHIVENDNINIDIQELLTVLPLYLLSLTPTQQEVFKAYYLRQSTIYTIRNHFKFTSLSDTERVINSATNKLIKMLKNDYSIK